MKPSSTDIARLTECLSYIKSNPTAKFPLGWISEVEAEARAVGLLPFPLPVIGINCRHGIDAGIVYGGDMVDVF